MDDYDKEPVLMVPPHLTKSSYATLLSLDCVPRKWHVEGRYGSRTHKVQDRNKIGIPLLRSPEKIKLITSILKRRDDALLVQEQEVATTHNNVKRRKVNDDEEKHHGSGSTNLYPSALEELLFTPGVELVYKIPVLSNRIPKDEIFDATIHSERMPDRFPSQLRDFFQIAKNEDDTIESRNLTPLKRHKNNPVSMKHAASSDDPFTFCELFSGIGGFGVALEALGGKCVFASEIYAPSKRVYEANLDMTNLPDGKISGDIWDVDSKDIPFHDLLVGGFPCQPFSSLGDQPGLNDAKNVSGRKKGVEENIQDSGGGRGQLFTQIVRVLRDVQPNAFLLENVPGLITTDDGNALRTIVSSLEGVGYHVSYEVCSSRGLTVQSRKRLYIVGIKHNDNGGKDETKFRFPFMPDLQIRAVDVLHKREELQTSFTATGISPGLIRHCGFEAQSEPPASMFRLTDSQMDQLRNRSKSWKPAKLAWDNTTCDTIDSHYGVTVGKGNSQLVPSQAPYHPRRFTPRECARIMGFNNSFILGEYKVKETHLKYKDETISLFNGFIKEQYYMLGNAVCPPVIAVLAGAIIHCIPNTHDKSDNDWINRGLWSGIRIAYGAVAPSCRATLCKRHLEIVQN